MTARILVAYATRAGSTAEVAEAIGQALRGRGSEVDVRPVKDVRSVAGYGAVVLGSGIRFAKLLPEVVRFAERERAALATLPTAYFVVCGTLHEDTPERRRTVGAYLDPLRRIKEPTREGLFGGAMDHAKLNPLLRWMAARDASGEMAEGDWRDWAAIRAWADALALPGVDAAARPHDGADQEDPAIARMPALSHA